MVKIIKFYQEKFHRVTAGIIANRKVPLPDLYRVTIKEIDTFNVVLK